MSFLLSSSFFQVVLNFEGLRDIFMRREDVAVSEKKVGPMPVVTAHRYCEYDAMASGSMPFFLLFPILGWDESLCVEPRRGENDGAKWSLSKQS